MFNCPFDQKTCFDLEELLVHFTKCIKGRNKTVYVCSCQPIFFVSLESKTDHLKQCQIQAGQEKVEEVKVGSEQVQKWLRDLREEAKKKKDQDEQKEVNQEVVQMRKSQSSKKTKKSFILEDQLKLDNILVDLNYTYQGQSNYLTMTTLWFEEEDLDMIKQSIPQMTLNVIDYQQLKILQILGDFRHTVPSCEFTINHKEIIRHFFGMFSILNN